MPVTKVHQQVNPSNLIGFCCRVAAAAWLILTNVSCERIRQVMSGDPICDRDNGGLVLPPRFCAFVIIDSSHAAPRHIAISPRGELLMMRLSWAHEAGALSVWRDLGGDGRMDQELDIAPYSGSDLHLAGDTLYLATDDAIIRYRLRPGETAVAGPPDTVVGGLPARGEHNAKSFVLGDHGSLFVNLGSPSNSCQQSNRGVESPGRDPCTELDSGAGIWRFDARRSRQTFSEGFRYATGIRNALALARHPITGQMYAVVHGRDDLDAAWPKLYTARDGDRLPGEEFIRIDEGDDYGWPYCYYDWARKRKVLSPDYAGDGKKTGRCAGKKAPMMALPGRTGPMSLLFYKGAQFPARYREGAFVTMHGPDTRTPDSPDGYKVVFIPFKDGIALDRYETFADGFAVTTAGLPKFRPSGLAEGPDGSIYVSDTRRGRVWRILYRGAAAAAGW
jgi:glucose/arabinose dehydrogenase